MLVASFSALGGKQHFAETHCVSGSFTNAGGSTDGPVYSPEARSRLSGKLTLWRTGEAAKKTGFLVFIDDFDVNYKTHLCAGFVHTAQNFCARIGAIHKIRRGDKGVGIYQTRDKA